MNLPSIPKKLSLSILRITMGVIFITHGSARLSYDSVADFGGYLNSEGFIIGTFIAWTITIGEIVFGSLLTIGYKIQYAIIFHATVILMGILLLHLSQGWFVVGHGSGGIEYSLLILAVLIYLYSSASEQQFRVRQ